MKLRFCKRCDAALKDQPDYALVVRALCELGHYVCPFAKVQCGKFVDAAGRILAVTQLKGDSWLNQ